MPYRITLNDVSNLETSIFQEICHKIFNFFLTIRKIMTCATRAPRGGGGGGGGHSTGKNTRGWLDSLGSRILVRKIYFSYRLRVLFLFLLFYIATCEFLVKFKICYRLVIFELSDKGTNFSFL